MTMMVDQVIRQHMPYVFARLHYVLEAGGPSRKARQHSSRDERAIDLAGEEVERASDLRCSMRNA
ncbi:MAG: hypothetical protein JWM19_6687 [Actinomycetia bacterium]|nr:hypothetical protein [Actinomycetes bacterium]